jgi:MFS transporter, PPP family, 3-phenylpropionic acid transporter
MSSFARLCAFWLVYMGSLGISFPFYGLYLGTHGGLSAIEVGAVLSMLPLVGLLVQPFWGQIADRTGARSRVLAGLVLGAACANLVVGRASGFVELLLATGLLASFAAAVMPMALSVSLAVLQHDGRHAFGIARSVGTFGYLVTVVAFPLVLRVATGGAAGPGGAPAALGWMFPAIAVLALSSGAIALTLPREGRVAVRATHSGLTRLARNGPLLRLLAYAFCAYLFLNGPIQLFPLFVRSLGGGLDALSHMWVLMLLLEIPLMAWVGGLRIRLGARGLLALGVVASGLRWAGSAFVHELDVAAALGVLHGVGVVGLGIGAAVYVEEVVPDDLRSTGQGLLAAVGIGLAGILSNLACGWLFDRVGAQATYLGCGVGALLLGLATPLVLPKPGREHAIGRTI